MTDEDFAALNGRYAAVRFNPADVVVGRIQPHEFPDTAKWAVVTTENGANKYHPIFSPWEVEGVDVLPEPSSFMDRFKKFDDDFFLFNMSYQLRDDKGEPGPWIARVGVQTKTSGPSDPVQTLYPRGFAQFKTEDEAEAVAMWGALEWLEDGRPPLKRLDGSADAQAD